MSFPHMMTSYTHINLVPIIRIFYKNLFLLFLIFNKIISLCILNLDKTGPVLLAIQFPLFILLQVLVLRFSSPLEGTRPQ
jgi:hypothetical protein